MFKHESLADIDEASLVKRLMSDAHWKSRILNIKGIDPSCILLLNLDMTELPRSPRGDVDLLLVPPLQPDRATAVQFKRIKIRNGNANKFREFTKGVRQVNTLAHIGFYQTYLFVLVVADSRAKNDGRISYDDGMSLELRSEISQLISSRDLDQCIGLMRQEVVQPMDHIPLSVGSYEGHLVRLAEPKEQSPELTACITRILATSAYFNP